MSPCYYFPGDRYILITYHIDILISPFCAQLSLKSILFIVSDTVQEISSSVVRCLRLKVLHLFEVDLQSRLQYGIRSHLLLMRVVGHKVF